MRKPYLWSEPVHLDDIEFNDTDGENSYKIVFRMVEIAVTVRQGSLYLERAYFTTLDDMFDFITEDSWRQISDTGLKILKHQLANSLNSCRQYTFPQSIEVVRKNAKTKERFIQAIVDWTVDNYKQPKPRCDDPDCGCWE